MSEAITVIDRHKTAEKLSDYLHHHLSLAQLVDWAELAMMDGDFEPKDSALLREIIAYLGVSDVKMFGLSWEDCEHFLNRLGYSASIDIKVA